MHARQPSGCIKSNTLISFNPKTDARSFTPHQSLGRILLALYHPLLTRYCCASIPKMVDRTPQISHCCPPGGFKRTTIAPPSLRDGLEEEASCINLNIINAFISQHDCFDTLGWCAETGNPRSLSAIKNEKVEGHDSSSWRPYTSTDRWFYSRKEIWRSNGFFIAKCCQ